MVKFSSLDKSKIQKDSHPVGIAYILEKSSCLKEMWSLYDQEHPSDPT